MKIKNNMKYEHPIKILKHCAVNLWLLLLPLLRSFSLFPLSTEAVISWVKGAWMDILVMLFILGSAFVKWLGCRYCSDSKNFILIQGIFFQKRMVIPFEKITAAAESEIKLPFMLRLSIFRIETTAGKITGDTVLWIRKKDCDEISNKIPICKKEKKFKFTYSISLWKIILYSFLFSSSLSGTIYIAAFFMEVRKAAREILTELHITETIDKMSNAAASIFQAVPKIIIIILIILLFCRFISFVINLMRSAGFHTAIDSNIIRILSGLFPRNHTNIYTPSIECIIMKQGLMSKIIGMASLFITYPSSRSINDKKALLVPIVSRKSHFNSNISKKHKNKTTSSPYTLWCFIWQPVTIIGIILGILFIISYIKPYAYDIIFPLAGILLVPSAAFLLVRLITFRSQVISWDDEEISISYSKNLTFYTIITEKENISLTKTVRTPMAKKQKYCNITIYIKGGLKAVVRGTSEK